MNRDFFFDQYAGLLLLYFFTPAVAALRGLQKITGLAVGAPSSELSKRVP
jgi:hypothetical protein